MRQIVNVFMGLHLVAGGVLGGCSVVDAYRTCGFAGCPGDAAITAEVRALFKQHPAIDPPNLIEVQTIDHVVYLYGLVDTDVERRLAGTVAQTPQGVTRVVNSISLMNSNR
jgi:osmotically-inducible protein OsmY